MTDKQPMQRNGVTTPSPDPTTLTTAALRESIGALRELIGARLDGLEKATDLVRETISHRSEAIKDEVRNLQKLHEEKFRRIDTQIAERDTRSEQTSRDSKVAVDAAFAAAKEAVGEQNKSNALSIAKSEAATMKQFDLLIGAMATGGKSVDDKIDDIKQRISVIETTRTASHEGVSNLGTMVLGVLVGLSSVASIIAIFISLAHK